MHKAEQNKLLTISQWNFAQSIISATLQRYNITKKHTKTTPLNQVMWGCRYKLLKYKGQQKHSQKCNYSKRSRKEYQGLFPCAIGKFTLAEPKALFLFYYIRICLILPLNMVVIIDIVRTSGRGCSSPLFNDLYYKHDGTGNQQKS